MTRCLITGIKLCKCGCGQIVKDGNRFIHGHNGHKNPCLGKSAPQLCACGCGETTKPGNKFIFNHHSSITNLGKHKSDKTKQKLKEANLGKKQSKETIKKKSVANKKKWEDFLYRNKQILIKKEKWQDEKFKEKSMRVMNSSQAIRPNKPEKFLLNLLNELYPHQWKYTGDFSLIINGKNPDFAHISEKKLIEIYGDYWHRGENIEDRKIIFREKGYETLILWQSELSDIDFVLFQLEEFMKGEY